MSCSLSPAPPASYLPFPGASGRYRIMDRPTSIDAATARAELVALLQSVGRGDREAFAVVYRRTSAKLYGICLRLMGSESAAQDVLQDVYVTVWRKAGLFDSSKASPITWLATLARNRSIDSLRRRGPPSDGLEAAFAVEDDSPSASEIVEDADDAARLHHCLDELEDRAQAAIRAAFLDGATYPELAAREGVPLGTMKSWVRRGLQRLRGCLDR